MSEQGDRQDNLDDLMEQEESKYNNNGNNNNDNNHDDENEDSRNDRNRSREKEDRGDAKESNGKRVFVGNLAFKTKWQHLKDHMRVAGNVSRVDIFENREGLSKGFGLVEYETAEEAQKAIREMNKTTLDGRQIFVREDDPKQGGANPRPPRPQRERRERRRSRSRSYSRSESYDRDRRRKSRRDRRSKSRSRSRSDSDSQPRYKSRRNRDRSGSRERRRGSRDRDDKRGKREGFEVVVKNMPWSVTWQQLKDAFREYGNVLRAEVPQDDKGRSRGFGYVRFEREKEAEKAIDGMDGAAFNGRKIFVRMNENN